MRVALLARVSTERQAGEERHSLPAQLRSMLDRAGREGWEVVRTFEAPGESASTRDLNKRPVLRELVEAARRREFELVLFHESSRLARDEELSQWLINELEAYGVRLVESDKAVDHFYSPEGRVQFGIQSVLDAWQRRKHGAQVRKGKREMFEAGLHVGDVPFGYVRPLRELSDGSKVRDASVPLEVVEAEAVEIRRAFEDRLQGIGATQIAERWNALGLAPHSKQGNGVFTPSAVESVLDNDFYCGFIHYRGERGRGAHEAILDEDLWLKVQTRRGSGRSAVRTRSPRALSGIAVCSECGGPLWLSWSGPSGKKYPYYRETSRIRQRSCANRGMGWAAEQVEAVIVAAVSNMALDEAWCASVDRDARRVPKSDVYAKEREELGAERRRAVRAFVKGDLSEEECERITQAIDARLASLPAALPGGLVFGLERLRSVGQVLNVMSMEGQREAFRLLFERVEVDVRGRRVWMKPWAEVEGVFRARREWVVVHAPPAGSGRRQPTTNPRPWLYLPEELVA